MPAPRISRTVAHPKPKPEFRRRVQHLAFIRLLPCVACGKAPPSEAANVRTGTDGGVGMKPGDRYTVPLCTARRRLGWPPVLPHQRMFPSHRALPHQICSCCLIALCPNPSSFSCFLISAACCCGPCGVVGDAPASSKRSGKSTGLWGSWGNQVQHASRRPLGHSLQRRCEFGARLWLIVNRYVTIFRRRFPAQARIIRLRHRAPLAGRKARLHR